jgi:hypothetical protein
MRLHAHGPCIPSLIHHLDGLRSYALGWRALCERGKHHGFLRLTRLSALISVVLRCSRLWQL